MCFSIRLRAIREILEMIANPTPAAVLADLAKRRRRAHRVTEEGPPNRSKRPAPKRPPRLKLVIPPARPPGGTVKRGLQSRLRGSPELKSTP